jgi:hypothetical protein
MTRDRQDHHVKTFESLARLKQSYINQLKLADELHAALMQEWIKMSEIQFTVAKFLELIDAHHKAIEEGQEFFTFEGHEMLVSYAKYLIEYLEPRVPVEHWKVATKRREHQNRMKIKTTKS